MAKSRFRTFDVFQKTVEEARIRTSSGGLVTLISGCIIFWLVLLELYDWRRIVVRDQLIVDRTRGTPAEEETLIAGERLDIRMNITFPRIPCASMAFAGVG
jgi:endoplasmic reticulum-Golgi intermediate compartment protein 3